MASETPSKRVRTELFLICRAVEFDQPFVDLRLFDRIKALQAPGDDFINIANRRSDAFAAITFLVTIAKFPRFVFTRARAARDSGASNRASFQMHIYFDCWIATRIKNFARLDFRNAGLCHKKVRDLPR